MPSRPQQSGTEAEITTLRARSDVDPCADVSGEAVRQAINFSSDFFFRI